MNTLTICIVIFVISMLCFAWNKFPMGLTALASMVLLVLTGCLDGKEALSGFSNTNNIVIASMFVVAAGLNRTQFIDKLSDKIVAISGGSFKRAYLGYLIIAFLLTNFLNSPLSVYAIVFPMCFAMSESFGVSPSKTMYALAVVCVTCCCALPLSAAITDAGMFNGYLEGYGITEYSLTAMDFMYARLPLAIISLLWAYFYGYKHAPEQPIIPIEVKAQKRSEKKPLNAFSEKMGVIIFFGTILLLVTKQFHGIDNWKITLTAALLTVFCGVLSEKEAIQAIPVSTCCIYVGCLAMATALTNTGAGDIVGQATSIMLAGNQNGYLIGGVFFIISFLFTQIMLNKAVYGIFIPIAIMTCQAVGANPIGPILLSFCGAMSSILTPMATPAVPMAMAAGGYDQKSLLKQGWLISLILSVASVFYIMTIFPAF